MQLWTTSFWKGNWNRKKKLWRGENVETWIWKTHHHPVGKKNHSSRRTEPNQRVWWKPLVERGDKKQHIQQGSRGLWSYWSLEITHRTNTREGGALLNKRWRELMSIWARRRLLEVETSGHTKLMFSRLIISLWRLTRQHWAGSWFFAQIPLGWQMQPLPDDGSISRWVLMATFFREGCSI